MGHSASLDQGIVQNFEPGVNVRGDSLTKACFLWDDYSKESPFLGDHCHEGLKGLGFATPDLTGFDQEPIDHAQGWEKIWHGIKGLCGSHETVEGKIEENVVKNMSPREKDQYDQEERQKEEYNRKWMAWATQLNIAGEPPPEPPNLPMHEEVTRRVKDIENKVTEQIRAEMSPVDRARLDKQMKEYEEAFEEATRIRNPMGTGEGWKPRPIPPALVQDYYDRVREAVDKMTS